MGDRPTDPAAGAVRPSPGDRTHRIATLVALYFTQGLPFGLFTQALPVFLRQAGVSLETIGLSNLLALPWALKFLWSPAIDRVPGPRRRVILPLNLAATALLLALAAWSPGALLPLVVVVLLCNLCAATQDIATDGYAVELLRDDERGIGNGVQVGGYRLGMIVGGGVLLAAYDQIGWRATFGAASAAVAIATLPLCVAPDAPRIRPMSPPGFRDIQLHRWFAGSAGFRWACLLATYKLGDAFGTGMVRPFLVDLGLSLPEIAQLLGVAGSLAGMTGAAIGGLFADRLGRRNALAIFGLAQVVTLALYVGVATFGVQWAIAAVVAEHLFSGMATATLFAAMMDACRRDRAGMDYTVQACVQVISSGIAAIASGWSAARLGYAGHFALSAALCVFPVLLVLRWPRQPEGRFRLG